MTIKEWFADNVTQIVSIANTFEKVSYCKRDLTKMHIQIRLNPGSEILLASYKIPKNKEFGIDVFLYKKEEICPIFIRRAGLSIGQVTVGIELAIKEDSPVGQ